jgi:hypothetical protein
MKSVKQLSDFTKLEWEALWTEYEKYMSAEFLTTDNPLLLHQRLIAARDLKFWLEHLADV